MTERERLECDDPTPVVDRLKGLPWDHKYAMTAAEWAVGTDPKPMLEFLHGKINHRKFRLFLTHAFRRLWPSIRLSLILDAVAVAERYADGLATEMERMLAWVAVGRFVVLAERAPAKGHDMKALIHAGALAYRAVQADCDLRLNCRMMVRKSHESGQVLLAGLLRELLGNPLRPVTLDFSLLVGNDSTIPKLAQAIYDNHRFNDLHILADALEEAGCTNEDILNHLRGPRPHVRGCWVLDLVLGKE